MQIIGLCRFSYLGFGGFQVEHETLAERMAFLYDPDRLEARFRTFEAFTLPAIKAQTDKDFLFLIVVGESFGGRWMRRLADLTADLPQARILAKPPGRHRQVMQEAINSVRASDQPSLQFRLDDDDAVAVTYVEKLRARAKLLRPLLRRNRHIALDFNRGHIARPDANGIEAAPTRTPLTTAGLAMLVRPDVQATIMNFAHFKIGDHMPVVTFPDKDMMLRGHTGLNDSRQKPGVVPTPLKPLDRAGEDRFRAAYNIDSDKVRALFQQDGSGQGA